MSIIPEYVLQTTMVRGIKRLRNDSSLIDQLFRNLDQKSLAQVRQFIKTQAIDLCINYPRSGLKLPAIVILLKNEREEQAFLGDSMGIDVPEEFSYDGGVPDEILGGTASVSTLSGNPRIVFGPYSVAAATNNTLRADAPEWVVDQYIVSRHNVRIVEGTGVGQLRTITGNSRTRLMVSPDWSVVPDTTSVFEVITPPDEVLGEPSSLYNRRDLPAPIERLGGLYSLNYQIQVMATTPELTIYLDTIIKAIFTLYRTFLEQQGVINLSLSATDFAPRPEYQPDFAYMRARNLEFIYPFDTFVPMENVARSFRLVLEGTPVGDPITVDPVELSNTTWEKDTNGDLVPPLDGAQRIYFGTAVPPGTVDASFIQTTLADQGTLVTASSTRTIEYVSYPGQRMYLAVPSRFGVTAASFTDARTGLAVTFTLGATVPVTTPLASENFDVWVSSSVGTGYTPVSVT